MTRRSVAAGSALALAMAGISPAHANARREQADVYAAGSQRLLYREEHLVQPGASPERWVVYRCPDGKPFARKRVAAGGARAEAITFDSAIYHGGPTGVLQALVEGAGTAATVVIVGHAPTMPMLAEALTAGRGSAQAHSELAAGFPTTGLAVLRYAGHWADLGQGTAELEAFFIGRG